MKKTKLVSGVVVAGVMVLPMLAACGQRGGLARPDPLFRDLTPVEATAPEAREEDANPDTIGQPSTNEFGGEVPDAAPTQPVQSAPLEETVPEPIDDTDEE